jgi:hypothetical protein
MVKQEKEYEKLKQREVEKWREEEKNKLEQQKQKKIDLQKHIIKQIEGKVSLEYNRIEKRRNP